MNQSKLLFFFAALLLFLFPNYLKSQNLNEKLPSLLINEIEITDLALDDVYIEMIVIKSDDIPHNVNDDKAKIIIDDSNEGTDFKSGFISIRPDCVRDVKPGDIIVIHGKKTDISNVNKDIKLFEINDDCIEKWDGVPNSQNSTYIGGTRNNNEDVSISDFFAFNSTQNKVQVRVNEVYFNKVNQKNENNYSLHSNDLNDYTDLPKTLGIGNNLVNQQLIDNLSGQSSLKIECELVGSNTALIKIFPKNTGVQSGSGDYSGPYTLTTPKYEEYGIEVNSATAYGLECGINTIIVTDQLGRTAQCEVFVQLDNAFTVQTCKESEVDIQKLICENLESDCIYFKIGNQEAITLMDVSEIPIVIPEYDEYPVIIKFSDRDGNIKHEIEITIDIIYPGDICDDNDACTKNDVYDESCNCFGVSTIPEIDLTVENEIPCQNSKVKFSVPNLYDKYTWRIDGFNLGTENAFETSSIGLVELEVSKKGCTLKEEYEIIDLNEESVEIFSSSDVICNSFSKVKLSIDPSLSDGCKWYDEFGSVIETDEHEISITHEGEYTVEIFDCERKGSIFIRGANNEDYKISPVNAVLCDGSPKILELSPISPSKYTILWSTGQSSNSISVDNPGVYSVTVTAGNNCEYVDKVEVLDINDLETLGSKMLSEGFELYQFDLPETFNKSSNTNESRNSCAFENYSGTDVILQPIDNPELAFSLEAAVLDILNIGCNSCDFDAGAYIDEYSCALDQFDLDNFLNIGKELDGTVKALMVKDEENGKLLVYFFSDISPFKPCINPIKDRPGVTKDLIFDILCGIKNEDPSLNLNYQIPSDLISFSANFLELLPLLGMVDDNIGFFYSLKVANLKNGQSITLPTSDNLNPERIDKICIDEINVSANYPFFPVYDITYIEGDFWKYQFEYCSTVDTDDYLYLYVDDDEKEQFHKLLTELTKTDEAPATVFDPLLLYNDEILGNEEIQFINNLPNCLLSDDILCELINKLSLNEIGNKEKNASALSEILETNSSETAQKIKDCIHNEIDDGPYLVDDIYNNFGYDVDIFNGLTSLFYTLNENIEPSSIIQDAHIYDIYASYGYANSFEDFNDLYTYISFTHKVAAPAPTYSEPITISEINDRFEHYVPYLVQVSDLDVPLPQRHGFTMGSLGIVPGVYVPYLLENAASKTTKQTAIISGMTVGLVFAISDVAVLYSVGQLASLEGAFALTDLSIVGFDLMASIEPLCDGLGIDDWCEDWKEVSTELTIFALSGRVLSSKVAQMQRLKNKWDLEPKVKNAIRTKHGDNTISLLDDLFGKVGTNLKTRLVQLYPDMPIPKIDEIITKFGNDGWFLATDEMAQKILQTANGGENFIDDLIKTAGVNDKIGHKLANVTVDRVKAWKGLFSTGVRTDIPWLTRASKWIDEGGDFVEVSGKTWFRKNSDDIFEIKNDKILPNKKSNYQQGANGTPVGDAADGYQVVKVGNDLKVKRVPDESPYVNTNYHTKLTEHPNAHVLERHGHDVTDDALIKRANEGIAPDGSTIGNSNTPPFIKPPYSSKFDSPDALKNGFDNTKPGSTAFQNTPTVNNKKVVYHTLTDGSSYGKGVPKNGSNFVNSVKVRAVYTDVGGGNFQLLTMFPDF